MSNIYFISDLHLGHKNILNFSPHHRDGDDVNEHDHILIVKIAGSVNKRDRLYILGDVILSNSIPLEILNEIPCDKFLVRGNHDERFSTKEFLEVFKEVYGIIKYKGFWLSHAPIHPDELRGFRNIHGHVHTNSISDGHGRVDSRYINVCVEALNGYPVSLEDIRSGWYDNNRKC